VKQTSSRRSLEKRIAALICASFLYGGTVIRLFAADDGSTMPTPDTGSSTAGPGVVDGDDLSAAPAPAPKAGPMAAGASAGMSATDDGVTMPATATDGDPSGADPGDGMASNSQSSGDGQPAPVPAASPAPSANGETPAASDQTAPPAEDNGMPTEDIEPPLPDGSATDTLANSAAAAVPLPANPALDEQFSAWDLSQVESPLFLSAAIDEFNDRPILLTGNWSVKPHLSIGTFYDGNVFLRSQNTQSDIITRVAPGITMRLGDSDSMFYLMADYTVGFNAYLTNSSLSTIDQDGRAQLQWSLPKTTIGLTLEVSTDVGQDVDLGDRVRQDIYFAGVTTHYAFGEKTSFDFDADYTRSDYQGFISSSQWAGDLFMNYQYSPKTQVGLGGGLGYLIVPGSPSQLFEQANVRATYKATGKLTFIGEAGSEFRQYRSGKGDTLTPVFMIEAAWAAREGTTLDLSARRTVYASALLYDQDYTSTSVDFSVTQRITDYVDVSLGAGYVNADYTSTSASVNATRTDNYFYIRPAVEWKALDWLSVGIFYQYSQDLSNGGDANSFTRDQAGVDLAILF